MSRTREDLRVLQALPLDLKISLTVQRLREWVREYGTSGVYLSWSGGKDSTVLRHIIRQYWPEIESVFIDTGLEYPEVRAFVQAAKERGEPVTILQPKMRFDEVIKKYGYPLISKEVSQVVYEARRALDKGKTDIDAVKKICGVIITTRSGKSKYNQSKYKPLLAVDFVVSSKCCDVMKKRPAKGYGKKTGKKAILATTAAESQLRTTSWQRYGCNGFDMEQPMSRPMSFWTEQDILQYIKQYAVEIPSVYGRVEYAKEPEQIRWCEIADGFYDAADKLRCTGIQRTGCIFCAFGAHLEKGESRFERLKRTHPRQYAYCIGGGEYNENGVWQPTPKGLGMGHVFDVLNDLYGADFIRY